MPVSEVTSDYSGSLTPTTSAEESEEEEEEIVRSRRVSESSSLLWSGTGAKRCPLIIFRPESLVSKDKKTKAIGEKYHLAYKMVKTESKLVRSILTTYGFHEVHPNSADFNLMWTGAHLKPFSLRSLQDYQKVNHFPRSYEITRKDRLYKNVDRMAHTKGAKHFDFMPRSYLMPSEYQEFCAAYVKDKGPWIVKPIASSRGRGIYLINNPNQVPLEDNIMVCKYVGNPLLIDGFKFDVRVYIAVTSYDPLLIYLFEEGLTRFATVKYEKTNRQLKNQMMHLTNYSINKKSHDYVRCEDPEVEDYGNKWSMSAMLRYLKQEGVDTNALMMRIEAVIIKSIISAELPIATACRMFVPHRENCIELYGFDILVDENLKPWLLEGNLSPSLACDAPLDFKIKSAMVSDFFSLAGFQCVDPMTRKQKKDPLRFVHSIDEVASLNPNKQFQYVASASRPFSAKVPGDGSNMSGPQNKRPVSASGSKETISSSNSGMSSEEVKVLRIAKEQYQRRGGFIRIFPTPETWELYGSFLEYKSNLNLMLAQKLFPDRVKSRATSGAYSSAVARMRHIAAGQTMEGRNRVMSERFMQYERKLLTVDSRKKRVTRETKKKKKTPIGIDNKSSMSQGQLRKVNQANSESDDVSDTEEASDISTVNNEANSEKRPSSRASSRPVSRMSTTTDNKRGSSSQTSISNNGIKKPKDVRSKSKTDASKSSKDELTGLKKVTQKIYSYKPTAKTSYSSNITTNTRKQSNTTKQPRQQNADSSTDDYSSSDDEDEKPVSTRSNKTTSHPKQKEPFNVLQVLKTGGNLGKVQARLAFSAYLSRVQNRLMTESEGHVQEVAENAGKQEEQMDLVLRFLKRAAGNLRQAFSVVVPSRRLTLPDRKRILAKQLGDFVHIYNKETDAMEQKSALGLEKDSSLLNSYRLPGSGSISLAANAVSSVIKDSDFRGFVSNATETELEEVLTTYTHKNKSASVFLGASKPRPVKDKISASREAVNRIHSRQPVLMTTSNMYQAEEHREGAFDIPPATRRITQQMLRVRSPSPNPSVSSRTGSITASATSSIQQAAYIYSAKLTPPTAVGGVKEQHKRPASARAVNYSSTSTNITSSSQHIIGRPVSAAGVTGSLHYQTAANEEAISEALQRLAERQAARQYSATSQLHALTQHLSNLNLANMNSTRHQLNGGGGVHLISQRTSSLTDLANLDNAGDFFGNEGKGVATNQYNSKQLLAQQSKELLQESKAKHQAMVAQIEDNSDKNIALSQQSLKMSEHQVYSNTNADSQSDVTLCNNNLLNSLIEEGEESATNYAQKYYTYVEDGEENHKEAMDSVFDEVLNNANDPVEAYNKCAQLHNQMDMSEPVLMYTRKKKRKTVNKAEDVWKTYHNCTKKSHRSSRSKSKMRCTAKATKSDMVLSSDTYKTAKKWGKSWDDSHFNGFLNEIKGLFENSQIPCKRWKYQVACSKTLRPSTATSSCNIRCDREKHSKAHTMVATQLNKNMKDARPMSAAASTGMQRSSLRSTPNNNIHKGPSLSPPSSVAAKKIPTTDLRPPQIPRPPDAPKPPPVIRKPLGTTKNNRTGNHPQLNGLSPNPSKPQDDKTFYNSLKYDTSTCATRINDSNKDGLSSQTRISIPRPSSGKLQPNWKP